MLTIEQPKHWLILLTTLILLGFLIIWSIVGRIPTEAQGRSVSISSGGVLLVQSPSTGAITEILVQEGESVQKDMPLLKIANPKLESLITAIDATKFKIERLETEEALLSHALKINESLFQKGLIAKMTIDHSKSALMQKQIQIEEAKSSLDNLFTDLELNSFTNDETFLEQRAILENPTQSVDFKEVEEALTTVLSPSDGIALEVLVNTGELVNAKQSILWMEYPPKPDKPALFIGTLPAESMGHLKEGLRVLIEPASVNPREYGAIIGKIEEIYPYPVSKQELMQSIGNTQIVEFLLAKGPAKTQITISPNLDPETPSGYEWTSGEGPPFEISSGTICKIRVIIDEQPPISYLIPIWRIKPK